MSQDIKSFQNIQSYNQQIFNSTSNISESVNEISNPNQGHIQKDTNEQSYFSKQNQEQNNKIKGSIKLNMNKISDEIKSDIQNKSLQKFKPVLSQNQNIRKVKSCGNLSSYELEQQENNCENIQPQIYKSQELVRNAQSGIQVIEDECECQNSDLGDNNFNNGLQQKRLFDSYGSSINRLSNQSSNQILKENIPQFRASSNGKSKNNKSSKSKTDKTIEPAQNIETGILSQEESIVDEISSDEEDQLIDLEINQEINEEINQDINQDINVEIG